MLRLSYPTETVLSNKITRNIIVLSFKDIPWKPLRRRPTSVSSCSSCRRRPTYLIRPVYKLRHCAFLLLWTSSPTTATGPPDFDLCTKQSLRYVIQESRKSCTGQNCHSYFYLYVVPWWRNRLVSVLFDLHKTGWLFHGLRPHTWKNWMTSLPHASFSTLMDTNRRLALYGVLCTACPHGV